MKADSKSKLHNDVVKALKSIGKPFLEIFIESFKKIVIDFSLKNSQLFNKKSESEVILDYLFDHVEELMSQIKIEQLDKLNFDYNNIDVFMRLISLIPNLRYGFNGIRGYPERFEGFSLELQFENIEDTLPRLKNDTLLIGEDIIPLKSIKAPAKPEKRPLHTKTAVFMTENDSVKMKILSRVKNLTLDNILDEGRYRYPELDPKSFTDAGSTFRVFEDSFQNVMCRALNISTTVESLNEQKVNSLIYLQYQKLLEQRDCLKFRVKFVYSFDPKEVTKSARAEYVPKFSREIADMVVPVL
jgi:hypothetical protein